MVWYSTGCEAGASVAAPHRQSWTFLSKPPRDPSVTLSCSAPWCADSTDAFSSLCQMEVPCVWATVSWAVCLLSASSLKLAWPWSATISVPYPLAFAIYLWLFCSYLTSWAHPPWACAMDSAESCFAWSSRQIFWYTISSLYFDIWGIIWCFAPVRGAYCLHCPLDASASFVRRVSDCAFERTFEILLREVYVQGGHLTDSPNVNLLLNKIL